jgi:pectate lyase
MKIKIQTLVTVMIMTVTSVAPCMAQLSAYDDNAPVGWGSVDGRTTGSNDENAITVTTKEALINALKGTEKATIYVKGTITFNGSVEIKNAANKTVYGLPRATLVNPTHSAVVKESGVLAFKDCRNIIIRNMTFRSAGAYDIDGNDNLTLSNCDHVWIDHCDFLDGVDGNFDSNKGSDHLSITWCRFRYLIKPWPGGEGGSDDHRNCDLWGSSDRSNATDAGKLRTTFANCWWDKGCHERMPRVRYGQVHIINCLYTCKGNGYCVGAGYHSNIFVDKCAFIGVNNPFKVYAVENGFTDYNITMRDCIGANDVQQRSGSEPYFTPFDFYKLNGYDKSMVKKVVSNARNGAGATLHISEGKPFTTAVGNK